MDIKEMIEAASAGSAMKDYSALNSISSVMATPRSFVPPSIQMPTNPNLASEFHRRLVEWINDFDSSLDEAHEVGVRLVTFGQSIVIRLHDLSFWNPSLMKFIGVIDSTGEPAELIQHVTQISILLTSLPRLDTSKPKQPIGFAAPSSDNAGA